MFQLMDECWQYVKFDRTAHPISQWNKSMLDSLDSNPPFQYSFLLGIQSTDWSNNLTKLYQEQMTFMSGRIEPQWSDVNTLRDIERKAWKTRKDIWAAMLSSLRSQNDWFGWIKY